MAKIGLDQLLFELRSQGWDPGAVAGWDRETTIHNYEAIYPHFYSKTLPIACVTVEVLAANRPDTVRGVMYSVVSAGWLSDTGTSSYRKVEDILVRLRERRVIPFEWITDNIRATQKPSSWSGLDDFADTVRDAYRKDFWAHLSDYVHIICEKDTVAGRVARVTREYDVPLSPLRGQVSLTFANEIAQLWSKIEKPIYAYYIGDHDPDGRSIERVIQEKILDYGEGFRFRWKRLSVRGEHVREGGLVPERGILEPKETSANYERFVGRFDPRCAEVEAISANTLRQMVRDAIHEHIPENEWQRLREIEDVERQQWNETLDQLGGSRAG